MERKRSGMEKCEPGKPGKTDEAVKQGSKAGKKRSRDAKGKNGRAERKASLGRNGAEMRSGRTEARKRKAAEMRKTGGWKKHEASEE